MDQAGGTKFVCAVGTTRGPARGIPLPHRRPYGKTIAQAIRFLREAGARQGGLKAVGIASFGSIDLAEGSPTWGYITTTPKLLGNTPISPRSGARSACRSDSIRT
ncbi:MAG: ROK family protein [Verrucomicrobiales bacterium]